MNNTTYPKRILEQVILCLITAKLLWEEIPLIIRIIISITTIFIAINTIILMAFNGVKIVVEYQ